MAKAPTFPLIIDRCLTVSIADLKRWGCLKPGNYRSGTVYWERGCEREASVGYVVSLSVEFEQAYIQFNYAYDGQPVQYRVPLIPVPANIGKGLVWFFRCPFTGQRCKKLHLIQGRFIHRSAVRSAMYRQQTLTKRGRLVSRYLDLFEFKSSVLEEIEKPYFKETYRGKMTGRCAQWLRKIERAEKRVNERDIFRALR